MLNTIVVDMMVKPGLTVPEKIRESTRFYLYFKVSDEIIYFYFRVIDGIIIILIFFYHYFRIALALLTVLIFQQ